ncbi:MAG TPA: endonuclease/exonuclease/phosphatase family protein [Polyangiaceae bacterium]
MGQRLRLVSWNLTRLAGTPLAEAHRAMGEPDIFCVQELRLRPKDVDAIDAMKRALSGFACGFSLCRDDKNVTFQGGRMYGVATFVRESLAPFSHVEPEWDREGRALFTLFPKRKLALVNVYAVNGTGKPYFDHELGRIRGTRHEYKRRFNRKLMESCVGMKRQAFELVLAGDWNISRTKLDVTPRLRTEVPHAKARKQFNETFMPTLDVVDVFRELHPDAKKYTWRNDRARALDAARVDYALVSRSMLPRIVSADIDENVTRFASDHAPLSVEWRD